MIPASRIYFRRSIPADLFVFCPYYYHNNNNTADYEANQVLQFIMALPGDFTHKINAHVMTIVTWQYHDSRPICIVTVSTIVRMSTKKSH